MPEDNGQPASFTGFARVRKNTLRVRVVDRVARTMITLGGMGTIVAVVTMMGFLASVVVPLFFSSDIEDPRIAADTSFPADTIRTSVDESRSIGWAIDARGEITVFDVQSGKNISKKPLFDGAAPSAWSFAPTNESASFGFADGTVRTATFVFDSRFLLRAEELPAGAESLAGAATMIHEGGVLHRTSQGDYRLETFEVLVEAPAQLEPPSPVLLIDHVHLPTDETLCSLTADGKLRLSSLRKKKNLITGKITVAVDSTDLPYEVRDGRRPIRLLVAGLGGIVYLVFDDGTVDRFDTREFDKVSRAETLTVVPAGSKITRVEWLLGRTTLLIGDDRGGVGAWFPVRRQDVTTVDGMTLASVHELSGSASPVVTIASSHRARLILVAHADGSLELHHVTSGRRLEGVKIPASTAPAVSFAPANDGIVAIASGQLLTWSLDAGYPEVSGASLFLPVWYENYDAPAYVWQSTKGSDDIEPKMGLWPLVFGTLKATFYSLLFGVPISLLAAIYTSEFLHKRLKPKIKPVIELMASLPSVVLGFLAALVIAPFVENLVPAILAAFITIPLTFVLAANVWQLLPRQWTLEHVHLRFALMMAVLPFGLILAGAIGPVVESTFFAGNIKGWLSSGEGKATGGWMILWLPISAILTMLAMGRWVNPWLRNRTAEWSREKCARLDLAKFLVGALATLVFAWLISSLLDLVGVDPRGSYIDTYDQRNALVVGFVMGFAIIPIIYTIAEDALSTVPDHLRAASLGAGATPWQTATRIVIPTAMSGLFSAIMVGLGRAVGETMIVLMAAGNTAILDWNIFSGMRTLSANIATELPESTRNSAHYRTLFLAALTLFVMTFILNSIAEMVRQRFRKRAYQL